MVVSRETFLGRCVGREADCREHAGPESFRQARRAPRPTVTVIGMPFYSKAHLRRSHPRDAEGPTVAEHYRHPVARCIPIVCRAALDPLSCMPRRSPDRKQLAVGAVRLTRVVSPKWGRGQLRCRTSATHRRTEPDSLEVRSAHLRLAVLLWPQPSDRMVDHPVGFAVWRDTVPIARPSLMSRP